MTSPLLVKGQAQGRCIVEVTPERAGWKHVGFEAMRLARGEEAVVQTQDRELCTVVLAGRVDIEVGSERATASLTNARRPLSTCRAIGACASLPAPMLRSHCASRRPTTRRARCG